MNMVMFEFLTNLGFFRVYFFTCKKIKHLFPNVNKSLDVLLIFIRVGIC